MQKLVWIDLETTGLDPVQDKILEISAAVTGEYAQIIAGPKTLVLQYPWTISNLSEVVQEMHTVNRLFEEAKESSATVQDVVRELCEFLLPYMGCPIAGSNPSFDRDFLRIHMPEVASLLSHRLFDLHTLRYFFGIRKINKASDPHRAEQDVLRDIQEYQGLCKTYVLR